MCAEQAKKPEDRLTFQDYLQEYKVGLVRKPGPQTDDPDVVASELAEATISIIRRGIASLTQTFAKPKTDSPA